MATDDRPDPTPPPKMTSIELAEQARRIGADLRRLTDRWRPPSLDSVATRGILGSDGDPPQDPEAPMPATTPTQLRLTAADKADIETIRARFSFPSMADAVRFAIHETARRVRADAVRGPEKNRKNPPDGG